MVHQLVTQVQRIISDNGLVQPGERILVAVSGGPDSVALLHILAQLRAPLSLELCAAYLDHGLRPTETGNESALVANLAQELGIEWTTGKVDTRHVALERKISLEHAARIVRYEFLRHWAAHFRARSIAVAHTADDQAEQILLRLLRGAGSKGLAGMRLKNNDIIRPLLPIAKQDLLAYLHCHGIDYCEDSSNNELCFTRNRIRHLLLPFLKEHFGPGCQAALIKSCTNLAADEELLETLTTEALEKAVTLQQPVPLDTESEISIKIDREKFRAFPQALKRRMVEWMLWQLGSQARYAYILDIIKAIDQGRTGSELHLRRGLRLEIRPRDVELSYPAGKRPWRGSLAELPANRSFT